MLSCLDIAVGMFLFLPGSWVQTQVDSPPKMSEIFYDLLCKYLFKLKNNYFEGGEDPVYRPLKRRNDISLMSSSGGTEEYFRQ